MTPAELLDLIIDRAPKLRAVGVLSVSVEGASFALASDGQPADLASAVEEDDDDLNPLDDPRTYGIRGKGPAPKFRGDQ